MRRGTASVALFIVLVTSVSCSDTVPRLEGDGGALDVLIRGVNICPQIAKLEIMPLAVGVGGVITLNAEVVDQDDDSLTTTWQALRGIVINPFALTTRYICLVEGTDTLTFTTKDESDCVSKATKSIVCTARK